MRAYRVMDDASSRKKNSEIMPRNDNVVTGLRPFLLSPLPGCGVPLAQGGEGAAVHQGANAAFKQNNGALTPLRPRLPEDFFSSPSRPPSAHVSSLLSRSVDSNSTADQTSASKPKSEPPPARTTPSAVRRNEGLARLPQEQQARATRSRTGLRSESKLADEDEQSRVIVSASHHSGPPGQKSDTRIKTKQTVQDHLSSHQRKAGREKALLEIPKAYKCKDSDGRRERGASHDTRDAAVAVTKRAGTEEGETAPLTCPAIVRMVEEADRLTVDSRESSRYAIEKHQDCIALVEALEQREMSAAAGYHTASTMERRVSHAESRLRQAERVSAGVQAARGELRAEMAEMLRSSDDPHHGARGGSRFVVDGGSRPESFQDPKQEEREKELEEAEAAAYDEKTVAAFMYRDALAVAARAGKMAEEDDDRRSRTASQLDQASKEYRKALRAARAAEGAAHRAHTRATAAANNAEEKSNSWRGKSSWESGSETDLALSTGPKSRGNKSRRRKRKKLRGADEKE